MKMYVLMAIMMMSIVVAGCAPQGSTETPPSDTALEQCRQLVAEEGDTETEEMEACERLLAEEDEGSSSSTEADEDDHAETTASGYAGKILAGTDSPYLVFTKEDYEKALAEKEIVVLYFYANWCPSCRAEQPKTHAAFDELNNPNVIGFRVNFKDSDTNEDEEDMARQFGIAYQHTKVILKDGKQVLKAPDSWDKQRYLDEINKVV